MKYILITILSFATFQAFAQCPPSNKPVANRETSLRRGYSPAEQDTVFFRGVTETFQDGSQRFCEEIVRDTSALIDEITVTAINIAKRFTGTANDVWEYPSVIGGILQANSLLGQFGTSITEQSVIRYRDQVDSTDWDITTPSSTLVGEITVHPNGMQFRLTVGASTFNLLPVGDAIFRIVNYPVQGENTDFFRLNRVPYLEFRTLDYIEDAAGNVTAGVKIRKQ